MTVFEREHNLGPAGNYQDLVGRTQGDFVAHLDGDDYWLPGKLQQQLALLERRPDVVAVYSNALALGDDNERRGLFNNPQPEVFDANYLLAGGNFLNYSSMMYRCTAKSGVQDIPGKFVDYLVHLRLSALGCLGYVNEALVGYRLGVIGSMTTSTPRAVHELYWRVIEQAAARADLARATRGCMAHFLADRVVESIRRRDISAARQWALKASRLRPPFESSVWVHTAGLVIRRAFGVLASVLRPRVAVEANRVFFPRR
jgi:Glycosyl transferase family 2